MGDGGGCCHCGATWRRHSVRQSFCSEARAARRFVTSRTGTHVVLLQPSSSSPLLCQIQGPHNDTSPHCTSTVQLPAAVLHALPTGPCWPSSLAVPAALKLPPLSSAHARHVPLLSLSSTFASNHADPTTLACLHAQQHSVLGACTLPRECESSRRRRTLVFCSSDQLALQLAPCDCRHRLHRP